LLQKYAPSDTPQGGGPLTPKSRVGDAFQDLKNLPPSAGAGTPAPKPQQQAPTEQPQAPAPQPFGLPAINPFNNQPIKSPEEATQVISQIDRRRDYLLRQPGFDSARVAPLDAAKERIVTAFTPKPVPLGGMITPATGQVVAGSQTNLSPDALRAAAERYLKTGTLPPSSQRNPQERAAIQNEAADLAVQRNIDMSTLPSQWQQFKAQQVGIQRFMSGPQGNTIRSLNVVVSHLGTMQDLADALKNGNIRVFNEISQRWAAETGSSAPTDFDSAKQIVGSEIIKALGIAGAGTKDERQEAADAFNRARSPSQIGDVINKVIKPLLVGQLGGLRRQFVPATGLDVSEFDKMLEPETRSFFGKNKGQGSTPDAQGWITMPNGARVQEVR